MGRGYCARRASTHSRSAGVVTLSRRSSPVTTFTRPPAASTSEAQSELSPAAAERSADATNACGVCTATSSSRGSVSTTTPSRTRLTVSATGKPGTAPWKPSARASSSRGTSSGGRSGRAASWTSTTSASSGTSASPSRTDAERDGPPATHAATFAAPSCSATPIPGSSQPSGATTTMPSTHSHSSSRRSGSARRGRPPRRANAFGRSSPSRSPRPAATSTAQTLTPYAAAGVFGLATTPALLTTGGFGATGLVAGTRFGGAVSAVSTPSSQRERVVLRQVLRVHQLRGQDLLRLHVHLLLTGREALLAVP